MADAAGLADDQVGGGEGGIDAVQTFLDSAVVMHEAPAPRFDQLPVGVDGAGAATDAEDAFAVKRGRLVVVAVDTGKWAIFLAGHQLLQRVVTAGEQVPQAGQFTFERRDLRAQGAGPGFGVARPGGR